MIVFKYNWVLIINIFILYMFHLLRRFVPKAKTIINIYTMISNRMSRNELDILTGTRYGFSEIKPIEPVQKVAV